MTQDAKSTLSENRIKFKPARKISADLIERAAELIEKQLPRKSIDEIDYRKLSRVIAKEFGIDSKTVQRGVFVKIFKKREIASGISPSVIAEKHIRRSPFLLKFRKVRRAERIFAKEPGIALIEVARRVRLPETTLRGYLRRAGIEKVSSAERGRRILRGRGEKPKELTEKNLTRFREEYVEIARRAIEDSDGDLKKAKEKMVIVMGEKGGKRLMNTVFPSYLVEQLGVEECANRYIAWLRTTKKPFVVSRELLRERRSNEYRERLNKRKREKYRMQKVVSSIEGYLKKCVSNYPENEQNLFIEIAREILFGKSAVELNLRYGVDEKVIIGIRREMMSHFFVSASDAPAVRAEKMEITEAVKTTRFYDTFTEKWVSPENQVLVSRSFTITPEGILQPTRPKIEAAFKEAMTAKTELPANVFRRPRIRQPQNARSTIAKPRIIRRKAA